MGVGTHMKNVKMLIAGAASALSSLVMLISPVAAYANTTGCNNLGASYQVAKATWGCIGADRASGGTGMVVYTYDVNGDGRCVDLYTRQMNGGTSETWNYHSRNCSGGLVQQLFFGGPTSISSSVDVRIYRSDYAYYTTLYNVY